MNLNEDFIINKLNTLNEHKMAKDIFVPVLKQKGLDGVKFTGGAAEHGIDIEYYENSKADGLKQYVGIQFKKGDIIYSGRGIQNSVKELMNQAEEAFSKEITSVNSSKVSYITRFIVATTGEINEPARKYINEAKRKGEQTNISYWDKSTLCNFIKDYWMDEFIKYFNILPTEAKEDDNDMFLVDKDFFTFSFKTEIIDCKKIKATLKSNHWKIIKAIINTYFDSDSAIISMTELLKELGTTEDSIQQELTYLLTRGYINIDDTDLDVSLASTSYELQHFAKKITNYIINEPADSDSIEYAKQLFYDIIE